MRGVEKKIPGLAGFVVSAPAMLWHFPALRIARTIAEEHVENEAVLGTRQMDAGTECSETPVAVDWVVEGAAGALPSVVTAEAAKAAAAAGHSPLSYVFSDPLCPSSICHAHLAVSRKDSWTWVHPPAMVKQGHH